MKTFEIKEKINSLSEEVRSLLDKKELEKSKEKMEELRALKETLKIQEELEQEELRNLKKGKQIKKGESKDMPVNEMRAITKTILGKEVTPEERAAVVSSSNGAVLPKQFINELMELKKGYGALKDLCDVIVVNKNEGTMPVVNLDQNELQAVTEGQDITDGSLTTTEVTFKCDKVGLIQTLSSELVDDAEVEIENIVKNNFLTIAVTKENQKILTLIDTAPEEIEGEDYKALAMAMDSQLPSVRHGLITLANVEGYAYLKNATDKNDRPLNLVTLGADGKEYFNGKPLIVFDSALTPSHSKKQVFYSLNMKEAVKYFERKDVTIARSTEAGFKDDTVKIRVLERMCVKEGSKRSIKRLIIPNEE